MKRLCHKNRNREKDRERQRKRDRNEGPSHLSAYAISYYPSILVHMVSLMVDVLLVLPSASFLYSPMSSEYDLGVVLKDPHTA